MEEVKSPPKKQTKKALEESNYYEELEDIEVPKSK